MSRFKAKMHQIRFCLGLRPDPTGEAYSAHRDSLAEFKGPTSKRREGGRTGGKGKEGGEGRGGQCHCQCQSRVEGDTSRTSPLQGHLKR